MHAALTESKLHFLLPSSANNSWSVTIGNKTSKLENEKHKLLVNIDFETKKLHMSTEWAFLMLLAHKHKNWSKRHTGRCHFDAVISDPLKNSAPTSNENNRISFAISGTLYENCESTPCSGLLTLEKQDNDDGIHFNQWKVSFHLRDDALFNNCYVKFRLPLYLDHYKESVN